MILSIASAYSQTKPPAVMEFEGDGYILVASKSSAPRSTVGLTRRIQNYDSAETVDIWERQTPSDDGR